MLQLICWLGTIFLRVFHFGETSEWQHLWKKKGNEIVILKCIFQIFCKGSEGGMGGRYKV